jgi:hypothetical protein
VTHNLPDPRPSDPPDRRERPGSPKCVPATFPAKSEAFFSGFVEENYQGINSIILWISLIIVELGFVDLFCVCYS